MTGVKAGVAAGALAALMWLTSACVYLVYPWQSMLIQQFGELVGERSEAGLYFKLPWQNLIAFDRRILTIDTKDPDLYITSEKENVLVDSYIKWRIADPRRFYTSFRGQEQSAVGRLVELVNRGLRDEIGKRTVLEVVSAQRDDVMAVMVSRANEDARAQGVEVVDVRIKRVELPKAVSENVYRSMIAERQRIANERRATGDAQKEEIRANADRDRAVIIAEAYRDSQKLRGEGDALAAEIYANAYGEHPDFYNFYRSLEAYRRTIGKDGDLLILRPDGEFFRYLKSAQGR